MTKRHKRTLLIFFAITLLVWIGGNVWLGGPDLSAEYREAYGDEHEHYLDIVKSDAYKHWVQRPALNDPTAPDAPPHLAENIAFVERYEAREAYQEELHRMHLRGLFFDFFNAAALLFLIIYFGGPPLMRFIDSKRGELLDEMDAAAAARDAGEDHRKAAQAKLNRLPEEEKRIQSETQERVKAELAEREKSSQQTLEQIERDLEQRREQEVTAARLALKKAIIDQAINDITERFRAEKDPERQHALVRQAISEVEKAAS